MYIHRHDRGREGKRERRGEGDKEGGIEHPVQALLALSFPSVQRQSIRSKPTAMRLLCSTEKRDRMSGIANLLAPGGGLQTRLLNALFVHWLN